MADKYKVVTLITKEGKPNSYKIVLSVDGRGICSQMNEKTANYICKLMNEDSRKKVFVNVG